MGVLMKEPPRAARRQRAAMRAWTLVCAALGLLGGWVALAEPAARVPNAPRAASLLAPGTPVRIQLDRLGDPWLEGRVVTAPLGCTLVRLDDAERRAGAYSVPLRSVRELQWADASGRWSSLPVEQLRAGDPARCALA
jgi:hypothetical protein